MSTLDLFIMQTYAAVTATDRRNNFLSPSRLHPRDRNRDSRESAWSELNDGSLAKKPTCVFRKRDAGGEGDSRACEFSNRRRKEGEENFRSCPRSIAARCLFRSHRPIRVYIRTKKALERRALIGKSAGAFNLSRGEGTFIFLGR